MLEMQLQGNATLPRPQDELDLRQLLAALWMRRWLILAVTLLGMSASLAYALLAPEEYRSSVLLIPTEAPKSDQLGAAAALLGRKGLGQGDLELYQSLLTSHTVINKLLRSTLFPPSDPTGRRVRTVLDWLKVDSTDPARLSAMVNHLAKTIEVTTLGTGSGGILQVTVNAPSAWLAQRIADRLVEIGQEEIRLVRAARSTIVLDRLIGTSNQAKKEWDASAQTLTYYRDRNRSIFLPEQQLVVERLAMEKQVKEQKYLLARREVEQMLLEKEKAAPPAIVLDRADLPAKKSKPKRSAIVVVGTLLSAMAASFCVLGWKAFFERP